MPDPHSGGCACGAIRYAQPGEPVAQLLCQCRQCQQRSGAGHAAFVVFANRADLTLGGQVATWDIAGDSGRLKRHAFCPTCGTPLFVTFPAAPDLIALHPGSLDDPGRFAPGFVTYAARALAWDALDPALTRFPHMPPG